VPPNVDFLVDDCEQREWLDRDVDFVHLRFMTIVLKDVAGVLRRAYEYVRNPLMTDVHCLRPLNNPS
jgi:hypothetical protein